MKRILFFFVFTLLCLSFVSAKDKLYIIDGDDVWVKKSVLQKVPYFNEHQQCLVANDANGWLKSGKPGDALIQESIMIEGEGRFKGYWLAKGMKGKRFKICQLRNYDYNSESCYCSPGYIKETGESERKEFVTPKPKPKVKSKPQSETQAQKTVVIDTVVKKPIQSKPTAQAKLHSSRQELIDKFWPKKTGDSKALQVRADADFFYLDPQQIFAVKLEMLPGEYKHVMHGSFNYYRIQSGQNSVEVSLQDGTKCNLIWSGLGDIDAVEQYAADIFQFVKVDEKAQKKLYLFLDDKKEDDRLPPLLVGMVIVEIESFNQLKSEEVRFGLKVIK